MKKHDIFLKTNEYVAKFKDGEKRYRESPLFNQVIQMLVRDVDPIDVINQLIHTTEDTQRAFELYMIREKSPMRYIKKNNKYEKTI